MNPEQPAAPSAGNPYDFIVNPVKPPKRSKFSGAGNNAFVVRIVAIVGLAVVLMIVAAVVINLFFGQKTNVAVLITLAQTQSELARVSAIDDQATDQAVLNAATSTNLAAITQQKELLLFLAQHGQKKISPKVLALKKDPATDKQLTEAKAASTFDTVYTQIMLQQLQDYSAALSSAYKNATGISERKLLQADFEQTQLLIKQWPTPTQAATDQATN